LRTGDGPAACRLGLTRDDSATSPRCPASGNKANPGVAGRDEAPGRGANCAKQSQFRRRVKRVKCLPGNELWLIMHARAFGGTKPIHASANRDGRWPAGPEVVRHRGQSCETNPIGPGLGRAELPVGERCKTNPICTRGEEPAGPNTRNEPNFGRPAANRGVTANKQSQFGAVAYRAKQSQSAGGAGFPTIPLFHPSSVPIRRPVYKQSQFCYLGPVTERPSGGRTKGRHRRQP
jgi:hypothetical protein